MKLFLIGLGVGLVIGAVFWLIQFFKKKEIQKQTKAEIEKYKSMLTDRMDLEAEGLKKLKTEVEDLKKQNENLRITNASLMQKTDKAESQRLHIYQKAVDRLTINSPGFGPAWQSALKESEEEFARIYNGTEALWKKVLPRKTDAKLLNEQTTDGN